MSVHVLGVYTSLRLCCLTWVWHCDRRNSRKSSRGRRVWLAPSSSPELSDGRLVLHQIEYRFHDATRAHIVQGGVGVCQVVASNESGQIESSSESRQRLD